MKIVIDIPDEAYNELIKKQHLPRDLDIEYFIIHGTPLDNILDDIWLLYQRYQSDINELGVKLNELLERYWDI